MGMSLKAMMKRKKELADLFRQGIKHSFDRLKVDGEIEEVVGEIEGFGAVCDELAGTCMTRDGVDEIEDDELITELNKLVIDRGEPDDEPDDSEDREEQNAGDS